MKTKTNKLVAAAMLTALVCIATMVIKIPSPMKGYLNLGDSIVLLCAWMLSPLYGFLAAGIGSAFADVLSGYLVYAPATFIIKGGMSLLAHYGFKMLSKKIPCSISRLISAAVSEAAMVAGYFVFEGFLYGFIPSMVNIPANALQGIAGLILGTVLIKCLKNVEVLR